MTINVPRYPLPLKSCLRLFLSFSLLHGASRPSNSAQLHLYDLFHLQSFVYGLHVRNDNRLKFSLYVFRHPGPYCGVLFGMGVFTAPRSHRNLSAWFDIIINICSGITFWIVIARPTKGVGVRIPQVSVCTPINNRFLLLVGLVVLWVWTAHIPVFWSLFNTPSRWNLRKSAYSLVGCFLSWFLLFIFHRMCMPFLSYPHCMSAADALKWDDSESTVDIFTAHEKYTE